MLPDVLTAAAALASAAAALFAVGQARREREAAVLPLVVLEPDFLSQRFAKLRIANVGAGPARDLILSLTVMPSGEQLNLTKGALAGGESLWLVAEALGRRVEDLAEDAVTVSMSGTCLNAFNNPVEIEDFVDFRDLLDGEKGRRLAAVDPSVRIADALGALTGAVEALAGRAAARPTRRG